MGLLEKLQRKAIQLDLLPKVIRLLPAISVLTALVSVVLITILPLDGQYRRTYISENALMPSQAYSYFRESEWNILRGYRTQLESFIKYDHDEEGKLQSVVEILTPEQRFATIESWIQDFGAKTATFHNNVTGDTLYGVLHAPRGDGTEAMVLCMPWHNGDGDFNIGGTALGVTLARYFSRWPIWSKNIIIVFSEDPKLALRSWVEAYHTSLDLTGGDIESAIVLDYAGVNDFFEYTEIYYTGLNGELPNLDLVNIAVSITEHEGMKVSFHNLPQEQLGINNYWSRLKMILLGIKDASLAGVKTVHGNEAFSGWRIQSLTVKACGTEGKIDITTFGRISEAVFRSVNNLLEKFHQSFFFYLLLTTRNFVSISSYLPSAVLLSITYAIASLSCLFNTTNAFNTYLSHSVFSGIACWISLVVAFMTSHIFIYAPTQFTASLFLVGSMVLLVVPLVSSANLPSLKEPIAQRTRAFGFLYFSLCLTSLLMLNFSLAFTIGLLAFPMTLIRTVKGLDSQSPNTKVIRLKNTLCLFISNPFVSILLWTTIYESNEFSNLQVFTRLAAAWDDLQCWTWFVVSLAWWPLWLLCVFSTIATIPVPVVDCDNEQDTEKKTQ